MWDALNNGIEAFMNYQYFWNLGDYGKAVNFMISAVILSFGFTLVFITPLLMLLGWSVKRTIEDTKANWTNVGTITTAGYHYQIHNRTGKRRVMPIHPLGDTTPNKAWLKGQTDFL